MRPNNGDSEPILPQEERHMHEIGSFALCSIPASIVAGRRQALVAAHLLHRRQVGAGIKQFRFVGAPHVMPREWCDPRGCCPIPQDDSHSFID
jgi:hypothetical protein